MARSSTSWHTLTGDLGFRGLRVMLFPAYRIFNRLNNTRTHANLDQRLRINDFRCDDLRTRYETCQRSASPSRKICDIFWQTLPWETIQRELGEIHVCDFGCGTGRYLPRLIDWSGQRLASYRGVDIQAYPDWDGYRDQMPDVSFVQAREAESHTTFTGRENFLMTQSAIEHFPYDLVFFRHLANYVASRNEPTIQVHLFPAVSGYDTYPIHGIRQYSPRTVSHISRLFDDQSICDLLNLGGPEANRVHREYVHNGVDRLFSLTTKSRPSLRETDQYFEDCYQAIARDMSKPGWPPAFYALVIQTRLRTEFFAEAPREAPVATASS